MKDPTTTRRRLGAAVIAASLVCGAACRTEPIPPPAARLEQPVAASGAAEGRAFSPASPAVHALLPDAPRWLLVGGGAEPFSTELQIESDTIATHGFLSARLGDGITLFAGGVGAYGVRAQASAGLETDAEAGRQPLEAVLAEIFGGAYVDADYRLHRVPALGPADADTLHAAIVAGVTRPPAGGAPEGPFVLWLQGHGEEAFGKDDGAFALWGGTALTPDALRASLGPTLPRDVRVVASFCHAGGFTTLGSEPVTDGGVACVLAATTWDRVASGCDPDPERRAADSYGGHLVATLMGAPPEGVDSDGDGAINWLEAHVAASVVSRGFDVPMTTSMRVSIDAAAAHGAAPVWAPAGEGEATVPEFDAAVIGLARRLGLAVDAELAGAVEKHLEAAMASAQEARVAADTAADDVDREAGRLRGALLARWAVLDNPGHPRFAATVAAHGEAIASYLKSAEELAAWRTAQDSWHARLDRSDTLELALAPWLRLDAYLWAARGARMLLALGEGERARRHLEAQLRCERGT